MSRHLILPFLLIIAASAEVFDIMTDIQDLRIPDNNTCVQEHQRLAECVQPHATLINYVMSTFKETDVYNIGLMRKALQISKNVSECLGHEIQCPVPKFVVFSLDTAIYAGDAGIDWMFEASQFIVGKPTGSIFNGDKYCDN